MRLLKGWTLVSPFRLPIHPFFPGLLMSSLAFASATRVSHAFPIPVGIEDAVVLIETSYIEGDSVRFRPHGTGFLLEDTATRQLLFITNRHLLVNRDSIFLRFNFPGALTRRLVARLKQPHGDAFWKAHPDSTIDVAALPIRQDLPVKALERHDRSRSLKDVSLGDEVYFVGFPLAEFGNTTRNYPILRHGIVSYISREVITLEGLTSVLLGKDMILIDATALPGNSGSPVLSIPKASDERAKLIGIIQGHLFTSATGENLDLGIVVPTDRILEVIALFR